MNIANENEVVKSKSEELDEVKTCAWKLGVKDKNKKSEQTVLLLFLPSSLQ